MSAEALAQALAEKGTLTDTQIEQAKAMARSRGMPLEKAAVAVGASEGAVYRCLAKAAGLPFVDPGKARLTPELLESVPSDQMEAEGVLPVQVRDGVLYVAISDPMKTYVADNLAFFAGREVRCALAPPAALKEAVGKVLGRASNRAAATATEDAKGGDDDGDAPIIRLVHKTIGEALEARASDIHIEPFEPRIRIRYRIDGVLREKASLDRALLGPLTSRIKIMAAMDIAEKRKPQDGRIEFRADGREIDIRTSVLPGNHGETIVMRLLDKERNLLSLEALGFEGADLERFHRIIKRPNGVFLVTGPTGSGKTTTLYAALKQLNRSDTKIITAEDPVEFNLAGINQCQVRARIGLTFERVLRAMLRQAPNIILVGEIRDLETAEIAVQAALTGHLVFSTLHTNDAPSAVTRLIDMGVKPFLVSASVQAVMAQRLVRVLCPSCKKPYAPSEIELRTIGLEPSEHPDATFYRPQGCGECEDTGYRGRLGVFELMELDTASREMIYNGEPTVRLRDYCRSSGGMVSLFDDGIRKIIEGRTSVEELLRVTAAS
ncbi:MAG: GspE/PulE family protein [Planctomycetota bacterium]